MRAALLSCEFDGLNVRKVIEPPHYAAAQLALIFIILRIQRRVIRG